MLEFVVMNKHGLYLSYGGTWTARQKEAQLFPPVAALAIILDTPNTSALLASRMDNEAASGPSSAQAAA